MKSHDRYSEVLAFVTIARRGGLGLAAAELGLTPSVVSRKLQSLEKRLGVRLFSRSTRRVRLTEAGAIYLEPMERWLATLDDADQLLADLQGQVRGVLRATVPSNFARLHIMPALPELLARHPELDLDLDWSDRFQDLVDGGFDVAIRIGRLQDSSLVARHLADNRRVLVAAPAYLERAGTPRHPSELAGHSCLHFAYYREGDHWQFTRGQETVVVPVSGRLRANYGEALYEVALQGFGILQSATFIVGPALRDGRLVEVLPDWSVPTTGIYAVYPSARYLAPKVRAFVDFFAQRFEGRPPWEP